MNETNKTRHAETIALHAGWNGDPATDACAVPLVYDDEIRVGLIHRKGIPLSRPGEAFAAAIRERVGVCLEGYGAGFVERLWRMARFSGIEVLAQA